MNPVDLSGLRIDHGAATAEQPPRTPLGARLLGPAIGLLLCVVAATFVWPLLAPPRAVRMAAVLAARTSTAGAADAGSTGSAQATTEAVGWVEPDPFPTIVRPLIAGQIATLEVLEGVSVERGRTVIARLESASLLAAKERAEVMVHEREAALTLARANLHLAGARLEQNADERRHVLNATTALAGLTTRLAAARARLRQAEAAARAAAASATAQEQLAAAGTTHAVALERARADAVAADAAVAAAAAEVDGLTAEHATQSAFVALEEEVRAAPAQLQVGLEVAAAEVQQAEAALLAARTDLRIATREFDQLTVLAPCDGVVLRLLAMPGDRVGTETNGIVALYDPRRLRARIDVPLDSLTGLHPGQAVELQSQAIGDAVVRGEVQWLQHESDLLKNTLQVKVRLIDPPALLRPETLCRARFLADAETATSAAPAPATSATFRVPRAAVQQNDVFVFDPRDQRVHPVPVEVLAERDGECVVRGELSVTQRVALEPVVACEKVREIQP